ncbi:hypothetical protein D3C86_1487530 [compost metagenome]
MPTAFTYHQALTMLGHIAQRLASALVDNARPDRDFNGHVFATLTGTVAALAILTTFGAERFFETVIDQRVEVFIRL